MPVLYALPPPDPGFELFVASQGVSQGLAQTRGPQVMPRAVLRMGSLRMAAQWRNISSPAANGVAAFFVRFSGTLAKTQVEVGAAYRLRTGAARGTDATAWEFNVGARRTIGKWGLRINGECSPDEFGSGQSLYAETGAALEVAKATQLSVNVGRRERSGNPDYTAMSVGVSSVVQQMLFVDARYYRTNSAALGEPYRERIVLSARLSL